MKFQGDMLNFCDFIQVFVFTTNHHLNNSHKKGPIYVSYKNQPFIPSHSGEKVDLIGFAIFNIGGHL